MRQLEVYVNEVKAGMLTELNPGKGYIFAYSADYVASVLPPVSLSLPKRTEAYEAENLFPFFLQTCFQKEPAERWSAERNVLMVTISLVC